MGNIVVPKNYTSFVRSNEIYSLCEPLFRNSSIGMVIYGRVYSNGDFFAFNTYKEWEEHIFCKLKGKVNFDYNFLNIISSNAQFLRKRSSKIHFFESEIDIGGYWAKQINIPFNVESTFYIMEKIDNYYEAFGFASRTGKNISSFYVNHYDVLENFMLYFKERGTDLIKDGEKTKIYLPDRELGYYQLIEHFKEAVDYQTNNYIRLKDSCHLNKYPLCHQNIKLHITRRELECLQCLSQGLTAKEAGNILQISPRTIETHIKNIKDKLGVSFQSQMLKIFRSSSLANL